jgi:hypothetical protein
VTNLAAVSTVIRTLFTLSDTAVANHYLSVKMTAAEALIQSAMAGGTVNDSGPGIPITAGSWVHVVSRFLSATQRRIHHLRFGELTNQFNAATGATSRAPTGMDTMTIGCLNLSTGQTLFWDGIIAEYWMAKGDVNSDGVAMTAENAKHLAFDGPFGLSNINVVDYMSFRNGFAADGPEDRFCSLGHKWAAVNGPTAAPHPQLSYSQQHRVRQRAHGMLLSFAGKTPTELRPIFAGERLTISHGFEAWERRRLAGHYDHAGRGRPPKLTEAEQEHAHQ